MKRHKSETPLAWLTLFCTVTHFVLETWYHLVWGQPLQALLVDYICVALMVSGGIASLKARPGSAVGLLAAGWAFALGFGWRSLFGRLQLREAGQAAANGEASWVVFMVLCALAVVAIVLCWALWLAWRQAGLIGGNRSE